MPLRPQSSPRQIHLLLSTTTAALLTALDSGAPRRARLAALRSSASQAGVLRRCPDLAWRRVGSALASSRRRRSHSPSLSLTTCWWGLAAVGDGEEAAALSDPAEEAATLRNLHAIRAALEDLEDQFECFLSEIYRARADEYVAELLVLMAHCKLALHIRTLSILTSKWSCRWKL